jgi:hypothetical protein
MRRRPVAGVLPDQMEKGGAKNQNSRLCCLAFLSAFLWLFLLYFHFVFLRGDNSNATISDQFVDDHTTESKSVS